MSQPEREYDVVILGAGLAGSCLARQLKLEQPDLSICVLDAKTSFDYWVGESTIEVWVDYATRCLGLGPYLAKHHVIKQSLRYYWDSEARDLPVAEMSEFGVNGYHPQLSYQLDRAALDRDLVRMNRELGVEVRLGTRVSTRRGGDKPVIQIDREGGHIVETSEGAYRCRWLIDAAGRSAPLARALGLESREPRHPIGGYWARYEGCRNIDDLGDRQWRRRTAYAQRYLATNHFMYRGYWIWLIPLSEDTVSVGVKYNDELHPLKLRNAEELTAFLREHRCMREILGEGRPVDFYGLKRVARYTEQLYSTDRWFMTGMSGLFADAFLSTGCAFIAIANRLIGQMIAADRSGDSERFARQTVGFERYIKRLYNSIRLANDHELFGSYDVMAPFRRAGQLHYHNTLVPLGMEDLETVVKAVDAGEGPADEEASAYACARTRLAREFLALVDDAGVYYDRNQGEYLDGAVPSPIKKKYHLDRDLNLEREIDLEAYLDMFGAYCRRACELLGREFDADAFARFAKRDWESGQTIAAFLESLPQSLPRAVGA